MKNGIPGAGDMKIAPVPSVVDLCITTLIRYGTKTFGEIIAPTLALLDAGTEEWHPNLAVTLRKMVDEERITEGPGKKNCNPRVIDFMAGTPNAMISPRILEAFYIEKGGFLRRD